MSSWPSSDSSGALVTLPAPEVQAGETLLSNSAGYSVLEFIGEGCFGKVAKCQNLATKETVAVKILKKGTHFIQDTEKELAMLKAISVLNPDNTNVVKFFEQFEHMGQTCLAFEMLDRNLYDLLQERNWNPLSLNEIRPISKQLMVALDALKGLGILHTDIKPDNIMFVNKQDQTLRVKLIDFGGAIPASKARPGMELQPLGYRAPEIALGFPFTEAIDVWGVGCVLAFLYLADNLFPVDCDYQMMKCMVEILGQPEDHLLLEGKYTKYFFTEEAAAGGPTWRLMTPKEYMSANNVEPQEWNGFIEFPSSLEDLVNIYPKEEAAEFKDRVAFVDILKGLLHLDGDQRSSPCQALQHSFITMTHLTEHLDSRVYLTTSRLMMSDCPAEDSADMVNTSAASAAVSYDNSSSTGSSDGIPVTSPSDEDPVVCLFDGSKEEDSYDDAPATCSFDKTKAAAPCDDAPSPGLVEGVSVMSSSDAGPVFCFFDESEGEDSNEDVPASGISDGELLSLSYDDDSATSLFDETIVCYYDSSSTGSFDGVSVTSSNYEDLATLFSDGGLSSASSDDAPATSSSDGTKSTVSHDDGPNTESSDGVSVTASNEEDSASQSSEEGLLSSSYPITWSFDEANSADFTAPASASSGRTNKLLKRIRRFFSQISSTFCCCCRSTVED